MIAKTRSIYLLNNVLHNHTSCWMFCVVRTCFDTPVPMHWMFCVFRICFYTPNQFSHSHNKTKCILLHVVAKPVFNVLHSIMRKWCDYAGVDNNLLWKFWQKFGNYCWILITTVVISKLDEKISEVHFTSRFLIEFWNSFRAPISSFSILNKNDNPD